MIKISKKKKIKRKSFNGILVPNLKRWNREKDINVSQETFESRRSMPVFTQPFGSSAPRRAGCGLESLTALPRTARRRRDVSKSIGPRPGSAGLGQCRPRPAPWRSPCTCVRVRLMLSRYCVFAEVESLYPYCKLSFKVY